VSSDTSRPADMDPLAGGASGIEPVAIAPVQPAAARTGWSARGPVLALAVVLVSVLAGSALFVSGYFIGQRNTPTGSAEAFQPFWDSYDAIVKRFALGGETQKSLVDGAIKGMVDSLGDPY